LRIFYFLSDFFNKQFEDISSEHYTGATEERLKQYNQILVRSSSLRSQMSKLLDLFYEEVERFKETGSFEIIWDDILLDPKDE
jgi:hypothetical protein